MPIRSRRLPRLALTAAALVLVPAAFGPSVHAEGPPSRRPVSREATAPPGSAYRGEGSGGWWVGTAGVAAALAVCGWASVASRGFLARGPANTPALRVVGRTSLSPRHTVYLLDVGGRVLLVGTGPQGAPSLLGELDRDGIEPGSVPEAAAAAPPPGRLDVRLGGDE